MFKDVNFEKAIQYKVGKFKGEELTGTDINEVTELSLNNANFKGEKIGIDLSELPTLTELKSLSLKEFQLTDEEIVILNSMRNLHITPYVLWI